MPLECAEESQAANMYMKVCAVSTYPSQKCGVGMYTSKLVEALIKVQNCRVSVIAAQEINVPKRGGHDNITIFRAWKRNSFTYPLDILRVKWPCVSLKNILSTSAQAVSNPRSSFGLKTSESLAFA